MGYRRFKAFHFYTQYLICAFLNGAVCRYLMVDIECLDKNIPHAVALMKAIANESRMKILSVLNVAGEKNVGQLEAIVGLSQSALSQHLARMRKEKLVETRRDAQTIYYSCRDPKVRAILDCLCTIYRPQDEAVKK
jgi:ArsR family transcriptional regulator, virulence genes transcriptional regulator